MTEIEVCNNCVIDFCSSDDQHYANLENYCGNKKENAGKCCFCDEDIILTIHEIAVGFGSLKMHENCARNNIENSKAFGESKYNKTFEMLISKCVFKYIKHRKIKGDSWEEMETIDLFNLSAKYVQNFDDTLIFSYLKDNFDKKEAKNNIINLMNYLIMIYGSLEE